jgi:hypothetical protein
MLPLLAISAISLFAFVALAVDLGMLAVSRTECQNSADSAALAGCRTLNNNPTSVNSNLANAVAVAKTSVTDNYHLSANFDTTQIQRVETGQYLYNTTSQTFKVSTWTDVTTSQSVSPAVGSWTAIRVTLSVTQPTYFMRVFGVTSMPSGATATAVYRPRDIAFVLDMTGSMGYASTFNSASANGVGASLNPDPLVPAFGHYVNVQSSLVAPANLANGNGEAISRNNYTITTPGGPPIVRTFYFDPANAASPTTVAYPVTVSGSSTVLKPAFHRWSPSETAGDSTNYIAPTYNFAGYNAFHTGAEASPMGPTPAPDTFGSMTDSGGITYVGDRWRRANGSINTTDATWATGSATTRAAAHALELLGYNAATGTAPVNIRKGASPGGATITTEDKFRDPVWEQLGYDLDIVAYRAWVTTSNNGNPGNPGSFTTKQTANPFVGYSMGPGYWGKTFFIWPPDPRAPVGNPGDANYQAGDWRRRYFKRDAATAFDPQVDAGPTTGFTGINQALLTTGAGGLTITTTTGNYVIDYTAVLKWIKSGPQTLPSNLRAGRVLYYASIPDDVDTTTGTAQQQLDKAFWLRYINYVVGRGYNSVAYLYGYGDSWASSPTNVYASGLNQWQGPGNAWSNIYPYMRYADSPNRPRLHLWFGPLSMMDFIGNGTSGNWNPGTCSEAQCWQLKAGMNSVISDLQANHPNDYVGLVMFAADAYNGIRRPMGQNYQSLKNALFYPKSLLTAIDGGDVQTEIRPYDVNWTRAADDEIPNANGSTDPNTGLAYAFNLLSPSATLPTATYGTVKGRRGSSKIVIFETDGVPNTWRGLSSGTQTMNPTKKGYDTYYPDSTWSSGNQGNGNASSLSEPIKIVTQMSKQIATVNTTGLDSGLSLPNAPARVYPIAFGDIFDPIASPSATYRPTALQFLANMAAAGNTGVAGATTIPSNQIITGPYATRISNLKDCMERIFQSGVAVTLIE